MKNKLTIKQRIKACFILLVSGSLQLRFGSSYSAYYQSSVTAQFTGSAFKQGWNLLGFNWNTATITGSPSTSAIDYLRFQVAIS